MTLNIVRQRKNRKEAPNFFFEEIVVPPFWCSVGYNITKKTGEGVDPLSVLSPYLYECFTCSLEYIKVYVFLVVEPIITLPYTTFVSGFFFRSPLMKKTFLFFEDEGGLTPSSLLEQFGPQKKVCFFHQG